MDEVKQVISTVVFTRVEYQCPRCGEHYKDDVPPGDTVCTFTFLCVTCNETIQVQHDA